MKTKNMISAPKGDLKDGVYKVVIGRTTKWALAKTIKAALNQTKHMAPTAP